jgi:GST-like protein
MLLPEGARRYETLQWVFWQVGHIGPFFGQVGFFHKFAGRHWDDKRPLHRYADESKRLLKVLDDRLAGRKWVMDDYTIADISLLGWVRNLITFYDAAELVDYASMKNVQAWLERGLDRPAVQRGLKIPSKD